MKYKYEISNIEGNAGDLIIVDTSGLHRGSPIIKGHRLALTNYIWPENIPTSVKNLFNNE